jgi:hypothetical protein
VNPTVDALTEICRIVAAVLIVRQLPAAKLGAIVAILRDNGGDALASVLIGALPFEPNAATLERLTDE